MGFNSGFKGLNNVRYFYLLELYHDMYNLTLFQNYMSYFLVIHFHCKASCTIIYCIFFIYFLLHLMSFCDQWCKYFFKILVSSHNNYVNIDHKLTAFVKYSSPVSNLKLVIAVSNTILNSMVKIESPCLRQF